MAQWYERSYRRNLIDMHIEDWDEEFLSRFDPDAYFRDLRAAHVASPMIYLQSHVGYCYWPTKSGRMHRAFVGREGLMRRLFDLCHGDGMQVIAYYSLVYNNWACEEHPEWRMLDVAGKGSRESGERYGWCCPNNAAYRAFVDTQVGEMCAYVAFEGIFFDMTFWPTVCYCESCRARWAAEVGGDMPTVVDWSDPRWRTFQAKRQEWLGEFASAVTACLKRRKPACSVEHQFSTAMHFWRFGVNENIVRASDYVGGDLYGGLAEQSFACKLYRGLSPHQPFEYMTSRCFPDLREHTTTKSPAQLALSVMTTLLHHGACVMIDAIDPRGTHDHRVYERIGEAYRTAEAYEPFLEGDPVEDVGISFSLDGKMDAGRGPIPVGHREAEDASQPHQAAALGAAGSLREHHIPFGVVCRGHRLDTFRVLVLPDVPFMDAREVAEVSAFVKGGGALYLSGRSAPSLVEEVFAGHLEGRTEETITYMAPTAAGQEMLPGFTSDYPMALAMKQALLAGASRGEMLATITLPYTVPRSGGAGDVSRRFASIHSDPPGRTTQWPALLRARLGKGTVVWAAAPIEAALRPTHSDAFAAIVRHLGRDFSFSSDAPDVVEVMLFDAPLKHRRLVAMINLQDRSSPLPVHDFSISVRAPAAPSRVLRLPEETPVPFSWAATGLVTVRIDRLGLFALLAIID